MEQVGAEGEDALGLTVAVTRTNAVWHELHGAQVRL
jgi:hypothetical protein